MHERHLYRQRNGIERYFGRIKPYRRVANRFDKKAANFLEFVWVASIENARRSSQNCPSSISRA